MKRSFVLLFVLFLGGCAAFGPGVDSPRLQSEYQAARQALKEAREWKAPTYQPDQYTMAEDRLQVVRKRHRNDPSESIIAQYRLVQIQANRATIDSLIAQLKEKKQQIARQKRKLDSLSKTVQNQNNTLKDRNREIERLKARGNALRDTVAALETRLDRVSVLRDTVATLKKTIDRQEQTIKSQQKTIADLRSSYREARSRIQNLQTKLESVRQERNKFKRRARHLGDTVARLRTRVDSRTAQLRSLRKENKEIARKLKKQLGKGTVRREEDRVVVNLQERILFGLGSAHLKDKAQETMKNVVDVLKQYQDRRILVEGHTDDLPIKKTLEDKFPSNWELSAQRAINVVKYMIHGLGMSGDRLAAVAYGQTQPIVPNTSTANRAKNRRVEIVLLPKSVDLSPASRNSRSDTTP